MVDYTTDKADLLDMRQRPSENTLICPLNIYIYKSIFVKQKKATLDKSYTIKRENEISQKIQR
jgi:hypothetical protein